MANTNHGEKSRNQSKRNPRLSLRYSSSKNDKPSGPDPDKNVALAGTSSSSPNMECEKQSDINFIRQIEQINLERERKRDLVYSKRRSELYLPAENFNDVLASARLLEQAKSSQCPQIKRPLLPKTTTNGFQALSENVNFQTFNVNETNIPTINTQLDGICKNADLAEINKWEFSPISKCQIKNLSTKQAILEDFGVSSPSPKRNRAQDVEESPSPVLKTVVIKTYSKRSSKEKTATFNRRLFVPTIYARSPYSSNSDRIDSPDESDDLELFHSCPDTRIANNSSPVPDPNLSGGVMGNILNLSFYYSQTQHQNANSNNNADNRTLNDNVSAKSPGYPSLDLSGDDSDSFHGFGESITLQQNFDFGRPNDFSEDLSADEMDTKSFTNENKLSPSKDLTSFLQEDDDLFANFMSPVKKPDEECKKMSAGTIGKSFRIVILFEQFENPFIVNTK